MRPTNELSPPPDYSIRLFPPGCQRLVTQLSIKIRSFYNLDDGLLLLLRGGRFNQLAKFYPGLVSLTLILELEAAGRGFGKTWARKRGEKWVAYVQRLYDDIAKELFRKTMGKAKDAKVVPVWMNLRVLFDGESYVEGAGGGAVEGTDLVKRRELRQGMVEAWELFKKGGK